MTVLPKRWFRHFKFVLFYGMGGMLFGGIAGCQTPAPEPKPLHIAAAASLQDVMQDLARQYRVTHPEQTIRFNFGASGMLARQIEHNAPMDVFISADTAWIRYLSTQNRISIHDTLRLGNTLVNIGKPLTHLAATDRLALADPKTVPAGRYARKALHCMKLWDALSHHVLPAQDVRAARAAVQTHQAASGIVYATDARGLTATPLPDACQPEIRYGFGRVPNASAAAVAFTDFILSDSAQPIWQQHGFRINTLAN